MWNLLRKTVYLRWPKLLEELKRSAKEIFKKPCSLDDLKALVDRYKYMQSQQEIIFQGKCR
jgi:hypothetical protein